MQAGRARPKMTGGAPSENGGGKQRKKERLGPYRMPARPPISNALTRWRWKVERTLGIGLWLTASSQEQERFPESLGLSEPLSRCERVPLAEILLQEDNAQPSRFHEPHHLTIDGRTKPCKPGRLIPLQRAVRSGQS